MQNKIIKCPKCGSILDVKNSKNEAVKQIHCPRCKSALKVKFEPQQEPIEAQTYYAPQRQAVSNLGETQLACGQAGATQLYSSSDAKAKRACIIFEGATYPLTEGNNIVGRKGVTSKATVQIETVDRYMSRQHVSITLTTLPDNTKKAVLSNYQNKNLTTIDGQPIENGDSVRLSDGDNITMGHTTVIFKLT